MCPPDRLVGSSATSWPAASSSSGRDPALDYRPLANGRLRLVEGDAGALTGIAPVDVVVAVHGLWHQPERDLKLVADLLAPGGRVALGYQLRRHIARPGPARFSYRGPPAVRV